MASRYPNFSRPLPGSKEWLELVLIEMSDSECSEASDRLRREEWEAEHDPTHRGDREMNELDAIRVDDGIYISTYTVVPKSEIPQRVNFAHEETQSGQIHYVEWGDGHPLASYGPGDLYRREIDLSYGVGEPERETYWKRTARRRK